MFKKLINYFKIPENPEKMRGYIKSIMLEDLKDSISPVLYDGVEYYKDITVIGYFPVYLIYPKLHRLYLYDEYGYDFILLDIPSIFKYDNSVNKFSCEMMDILNYNIKDFNMLKFLDYNIKHNGKIQYNGNSNITNVEDFIKMWQTQNSLN